MTTSFQKDASPSRLKFYPGQVVQDAALGARQIRVRASSESIDRVGDIIVAKGCVVRGNSVPFLLNHSKKIEDIVGRAYVTVSDKEVFATVEFLPEGHSKLADDACMKFKGGFASDVSIGFNPIEAAPRKGGGYVFNKWELLELSGVVVGANQDAVVTQRAFDHDTDARAREIELLRLKASATHFSTSPAPRRAVAMKSDAARANELASLRTKGAGQTVGLQGPQFAAAKSSQLVADVLKRARMYR